MADPLSLAASIAGLISLADVAFKYAYKFVRAAKDAKDDILSLADEINNLASVLRVLGALASDLEAEGDQFDPTLRNHYLNHCFKTLTHIETRVKKAADSFSRSKLEGIYRQLKWPFSSSETKDLLAELSRHKETINVALAADSMRKLQLSLSKSDELGKQISAIGKVVRRIEINTLIDVNDTKKRVLNYFMKRNPQPNLETSIRLRHSMTGLWLTESQTFVRWLNTPSSKLWLTGIPGAGKTVLAGSVIQEALSRSYSTQGIGVAFFFCDYKDSATWQTVNILGAVASQLARQNNEAFEILNQYYQDLNPPRGLPQTPDPDELRSQINRMSELFDQTIVVIDGLDECGDCTDDVVDILIQVAEYSEGTSLAIFSRDHFNIRVHLEQDFGIVPIEAHTNDIQLYVNSEVDKRIRTRQLQLTNVDMKEEIQEILVRRADGMFRWVVCQLDYLCECAHDEERREALNRLPPDLPESYRRLLERVNRCSPRVQEIVQMCLHFMTVPRPRLTILEIRQAVSAPSVPGETLSESNTISEQEITRRCSSLIRKSQDGKYFEFAHFSVQEFLEDKNAVPRAAGLEKYWISQTTTRSLLAAQCLRFLLLKNFDTLPTEFDDLASVTHARDKNYPFYRHAVVEWIRLTAVDGLDDSTILPLARTLFQRSKHANFISWAIEVLDHVIVDTGLGCGSEDAQEARRKAWGIATHSSFRPLHMAASLNLAEICSSLINEEPSTNRRFNSASCLDLALVSVLAIPGMVDLHGDRSAEYRIARTARYRFLPSSKRRNATIDYLIKAGEKPSHCSLSPNTVSVFSITCVFAAVFHDFSPVTRILACNIIPLQSEIQIFDDWINSTDDSDNMADVSGRALLQYLDTADAFKTDWGKEIGSIVWNWALKRSSSFANAPELIGLDIFTSKDTILTRLFSAISSDNANLTARCLSDGRIDKHDLYTNKGYTLLHLAVENNAFETFKLLVDEGCDPYAQTFQGDMPIHLCERRYGPRPFKVLKDLGISLSSQNKSGCNIWHLWVMDEPIDYQFAYDMFELDPKSTSFGLQTKNTEGDTPMVVILKLTGEFRSGDGINKAQNLSVVCYRIACFWQNHGKVSDTETDFETMGASSNAVEANPEFQAMINTDHVPLYNFDRWITLEDVKLLTTLYPRATSCRVDGKLPVEDYIMAALRRDEAPKEEIVEALFPQNIMESQSSAKRTLWDFACSSTRPGTFERICDGKRYYDLHEKKGLLDAVLSIMLRLGAMKAHERQLKESGLVPLLAEFRANCWHVDNPDNCGCPSMSIVRDVSLQTEFWAGVKDLESTARLFKAAIHDADLEMIRILLEHKVNSNVRVHEHSPIEVAFDAPTALRICSSEEGIALFRELVDQSNGEDLKQMYPIDRRPPLLHRLATSEDAASILWLAEALVQRGMDINQVEPGYRAGSALTHHLGKSSFQFAELLLKLGANPSTAIHMGVVRDDVAVLRTILTHTTMPINWNAPVSINIRSGYENFYVTKGGLLHLASGNDSIGCLKFLIDEGLATQASVSVEGFTPVHTAVLRGSERALKLLLTSGFSGMTESKLGRTPLHMAVCTRSLPMVECLLKHGVSDSFDAGGKTSRRLAFELGLPGIVKLLDKVAENGGKPRLDIQKRDLSRQQTKRFTIALEQAVREDDYDTLEMIVDSGGSIDKPLCSGKGRSALILALELQNRRMAKWLLDHGASTLTAKHTNGVEGSVIEIASAQTSLNELLPELMEIYFGEGGDLICGDDFPLHDAVCNDNYQGVEHLISAVEFPFSLQCCFGGFTKHTRHQRQITSRQALEAILNRQSLSMFSYETSWRSGRHCASTAPLHIASWLGNKSVASLLVKKGANIDAPDANGWTPLIYTRSADMAQHLILLGASTATVCRCGPLPALISWFGAQLFCELYPILFSRLPEGLLVTSPSTQFPTRCDDIPLTNECLKKLSELNYDLVTEDEAGRSLMHCIMCEDDLSGFILDNDQGLNGTGPFPWHLEWRPLASLAFLASAFERFRERVPSAIFRRVLNLEPARGWSPMRRAASLNLVDIVANCLKMGADVDFEGCPLGSAVMIASACGSLGAVKLLVRNGASISYICENRMRSCYLQAGSEDVRAWLLSGRFRDQLRITDRGEFGYTGEEAFWSGFVQAKLKIYGKRARAPTESSLDYAKRLAKMKKSWEGKVVPVYVERSKSESELGYAESGYEPESESGFEPESESGFESGSTSEVEPDSGSE